MTELTVKENMVASVHYTGTLPDSGEVFDSSEGREPLSFLVGHKQMIPGFEEEIMGAKVGEKKEFTLSSERAYGDRDEQAVQQIAREQFAQLEQEATLEVGMQLVAQGQEGPMPFIISELSDETICRLESLIHKFFTGPLCFSLKTLINSLLLTSHNMICPSPCPLTNKSPFSVVLI